ncbi:hypothetical protein JJB99_12335 [Bradyrhizobium diazoefficiens]|uniref:hypothetical protein n=1 Tax=Bradyrhizobium diazoefficiens TaxID=1355477 RepID=UPI00190CDDD0|nr:hypothetical protein [Bradyrhizobium diazoefficiens]QQO16866.1 hypothetical protein JJB99_12335 [Bradyrhizobium diazoefficiens]
MFQFRVFSIFAVRRLSFVAAAATTLTGCITTSMQGYADRDLPSKPITRIVAYVAGPPALVSSIQATISEEGRKRGVVAEDAFALFPPTRTYTNAEIRQGLTTNSIDGVLVLNVGDSGVQQQYAGTILSGQYSGSSTANGTINTFGNVSSASLNGVSSGTVTATATPVYHYRRQTAFTARLLEPATGRNLWVGNGQVNARGSLFVGDGANASSSVGAIFDDLQRKGIIGGSS